MALAERLASLEPSQPPARGGHVRGPVSHADREGEVGEVEVGGRLAAGEVEPARVAVLAVVQPRVVQRESGVNQDPSPGDRRYLQTDKHARPLRRRERLGAAEHHSRRG